MTSTTERITGTDRSEPWLRLDDYRQQTRRLIGRLAAEVWDCVLVGRAAPKVQRRFERMSDPQVGDLIVELTALHRDDSSRYQAIGYLLGIRPEAEGDAWYVQYGPSPDDVCRWTNAEFIAVDLGMM
jgi:hypothetical protein